MKNFILALLISIVIHFLLLFSFQNIETKLGQQLSSKTTDRKLTYIKLASIKQPKKIIKKIKKPVKKEIKKKVVKKFKPIKTTKKIYKKVVQKNIKSDKRKSSFINRSKSIQKPKNTMDERKQELKEIEKLDKLTRSYIQLYGEEYFSFSKETKKYLKNNLNKIGTITQQYLRYPSIAVRTNQHGTNVVEFILKPNGDITNLKLTYSSNYSSLDKNTIKTIKIAYKDYPRPKKDTKIKIYVSYILF